MKKRINQLLRKVGYEIRKKPRNIHTRKTDELTLYHTVTGSYYLPTHAHADIVANAIINNQIFENEVVELAYKYIKPNSVVLDVGANFGQMSNLFAKKVGSNGKVYAFDADEFVFEILKKNIAVNNNAGTIMPIFGAVHNISGQTLHFPVQDFEIFGTYGSFGVDYNAKDGRIVQSITIDSLNIKEPISFMKIDIQGGDLQAMQGAINTIKKYQMPILFEYEYHFEDKYNLCFQDYVDFVGELGYVFKKVINGHNYLIVPKEK